jgi:shikimate dehydrogenase
MNAPIRLGIFGWPVEHSKSPAMHESAARALGIRLIYEKFGVRPAELSAAIQAKHEEGIDGYNLTVPHKEAIVPLLDEVSDEARAIGAVNTVVRQNHRYVGHNTDARGFVQSLGKGGVTLKGLRATIVGAGGASRAGVVGLSNAGASSVTVVARRPERAVAMVDALRDHVDASLDAYSLDDARAVFSRTDLLVQATSATLESNPDAGAFANALPMDALPQTASVVDMVYKPLRTTVLARAEELGLHTVDGLGMLLHQGAIAFEMWTGRKPSLDVMRAALSD